MKKSVRIPILFILLVLGVLSHSPFLSNREDTHSSSFIDSYGLDPELESGTYSDTIFKMSSGPTRTGILPGFEFLQYGTNIETTGMIFTRTDEQPSVTTNLALDTANGWKSNQLELNISELRRLFALNGTFGSGYPGINDEPSRSVSYYPMAWDADSLNDEPTKQTMRASYNDTSRKFGELEVEGEATGNPWDFKIYKNSHVFWFQEVTRDPLKADYLLSFDLLYDSGPIGIRHLDDFQLRIEADWGTGSMILWSIDPVTIPARDYWDSIGPLPISLTGVPNTFELRFVFEILEDRTLEGDREDFDNDWDNAKFVRFYIDDLSLAAADYSDPEDVNLRVDVSPVGETTVSGAAGYGRVLVNHSYWETSPLPIEILSDSPVSYEYEARFLRTLRMGNTSWENSLSETGVAYSVDIDASPALTSYFNIPDHDNLEDFTLELSYLSDYENATVVDADSIDVTASCTISDGMIKINGEILESLGWWEVNFEAPNYANAITTQRFVMPSWENETRFNSWDQIRSLVEIGTPTSIPPLIEDLSVEWFQPNGTQWHEETVNDGVAGIAYSSPLSIGAYNGTPGVWTTRIFWHNATEVAYSDVYFELNHDSTLAPVNSLLEGEDDTVITCSVYLLDVDTNEYLLDDQCIVVGNWSGNVINFQRNLAKSWWEGELNTSLVGRGTHTIRINATRPYYGSSNCTVTVEVTSPAIFSHLGEDYEDVNLGSSHIAKFRYQYPDDVGIEDALIEVISVSGPMGGLSYGNSTAVAGEIGNYSIKFTVHIGGAYSVIVRASKVEHNTETASFNIITTDIDTELVLLNGTSDAINVGAAYQLFLHYRNSTGEGLPGAEVIIMDVVPISGLSISPTQFHGNGTYSILIDGDDAGIFSITIRAGRVGYETQLAVFTLVVSPIPTILSVDPTVDTITVDCNYTLYVTFTNKTFYGLENATISIVSVDSPSGLWYSEATDLGSGLYSVSLMPSVEGTYSLLLGGFLEGYQNSTTLFTLVVTEIPADLRTSNGLVSGFCYFTDTFEVLLLYETRENGTLIPNATIDVSAVPGLEYTMVETPQGYLLTINPSVQGRWSLSLSASRLHYTTATMIFDLEVRETLTRLTGDGPPIDLYFGVTYKFMLSYNHNDTVGITNATISLTYRGIQGSPILWTDNDNGSYSFTMTAGDPGSYAVSVEFSKYGYEPAENSFSFTILEVPTTVYTPSIPAQFYDSRTYELDIHVSSSEHGDLEDAEVTYSPSLILFIIDELFGNGWYNITFTPETGNFSTISVHITKHGYEEAKVEFPLSVGPIPFVIPTGYQLDNTYSLLQGDSLSLTLQLTAGDNGEQISNALVSY
ncbi:MAG: hypothetical protein RTU30_15075, partial [Candidatus Thorarchaeota archaeon]